MVQVGYVGTCTATWSQQDRHADGAQSDRINPFTGLRPDPTLGDIMLVGNYPESNYDALQVGFKRALAMGLALNANYTYAVQKDNAIGFLSNT